LLVHYYLEEAEMTNSSIQLIEKQIIAREKRLKEQPDLVTNEHSNDVTEKYFQIDDEIEIDLESDYLESWLEFEREEQKPLEIDASQSDMFNFHELITSDDKLTNTLLNFCPKVEKNDIICDVNNEFYSLAMIKLIHSFLHKTELFEEIEFTVQCLQDGDYDLKYLRMLVNLYVERYGNNWDWTDKRKDKFLLCSICHIIRGTVNLSKLDLIDSLDIFFKWKGKIYQIGSNNLKSEKGKTIQLLQLNEEDKTNELSIKIDLRNITQEAKLLLDKLMVKCDDCQETQEVCMKNRKEITAYIKSGNEIINKIWNEQPELHPCIANIVLDQVKKGLL
jgi:hypothetical protein